MLLFRKAFQPFPGPEQLTMILGSTCCTWRKEIKPYQSYEIWTRVLSWDEKWIYMVAHFVEPDSFLPTEWVLKPHSKPAKSKTRTNKAPSKAVFASSVSRYVFKSGRKTVPPEVVLQRCRLLPAKAADKLAPDGTTLEEIERQRQQWLPVAQLRCGWDAVHNLFPGEQTAALGRYAAA